MKYLVGKLEEKEGKSPTIQLMEDHGHAATFETLEEAMKSYQWMAAGTPLGKMKLLKVIDVKVTATDDEKE